MGVSEPLIQASLLGEAVENGPVAVFVADEHGQYVAVNQAACLLLGYTREELLGLRVTDVARYDERRRRVDRDDGQPAREPASPSSRARTAPTVEFSYVAGATVVAGMPRLRLRRRRRRA